MELLLPRLSIIIEKHELIPNHQFEFQYKHAIIEQIHRIVKRINKNMEADRYGKYTAVFFDVSQVFNKVYQHERLFYKIKVAIIQGNSQTFGPMSFNCGARLPIQI